MSRGTSRSAAFCLHARPYRESSAILQLFTRDFGRVSVVQRGARTARSARRGSTPVTQPFTSLQVEWFGHHELKTLARIETESPPAFLSGPSLFAGLYLNELLNIVLPEQQECPALYAAYEDVLQELARGAALEAPLRVFERCLLEELGYGIPFRAVDPEGHALGELESGMRYVFAPESGFIPANLVAGNEGAEWFDGCCLLRVAAGELDAPDTLRAAKHLMRRALSPLLGNRMLNSRHLFL